MRRSGPAPVAVMALVSVAGVAAAQPSNPAFLGIAMRDAGGPGAGGPCVIESVTRGSGAHVAGLRSGDRLQTLGGATIANCDAVLRAVQGRAANDSVEVAIVRAGQRVVVHADLLSRAEILRARLVGQPIMPTELHGLDDRRTYDLSALRGRTAIVGWFDASSCAACGTVFRKLARWTRGQDGKLGPAPLALAVTIADPYAAAPPSARGLEVPLALADPDLYAEFTIPDRERIFFTVIDARGVVQYVSPVIPHAEDEDAVLDELFAAVEQASRRQAR